MAIAFEKYVTFANKAAFITKVKQVSARLGINPNWLMAVMWYESGINPKAVNKVSGATGLIQFMPETARGLGTSTASLRDMDAVTQLDYVYKYLAQYKSKLKSFADTYLAVFFPIAIGKPDNWVFKTNKLSAELIARQNGVIDQNRDGVITTADFKKYTLSRIPESEKQYFAAAAASGAGLLLLAGAAYFIYKKYYRV